MLEVERMRNGIVQVTMNRPPLNALDETQIQRLASLFEELASSPETRVLLLTGTERAFSVGLDLELLGRGFEDPSFFDEQLAAFASMLEALEGLEIPTIAAAAGIARAGGFEMLLCCDLVLAAEDARIGDMHLQAGLPPGGGATARLPRRVGDLAARDLLLTGRTLSGSEAQEIGLVSRTVPHDQLLEEALALAEQLAALSAPALRATRRILRRATDLPLADALAVEADEFQRFIREEPSASEGFRAFRENREPRWNT